VAVVIDDADSAEIPAAAVELEVGGMFSSPFPDGIALGAKVKAAVKVKTSVLEINTTIEVKVKAAAGSMQLSRSTQLSRSAHFVRVVICALYRESNC
jgi:hypothetical protein